MESDALKKSKRKQYRLDNLERVREIGRISSKKYYRKNKQKLKEKSLINRPVLLGYKKDYYIKNKAKFSNLWHIKQYGITLEDKLEMLRRQKYSCQICEKTLNNTSESYVDHDHKTGEIRGLLCNSCNTALGLFRDSKEILKSAIKYLK